MAGKKTPAASAEPTATEEEPTKAELQRRMEETRESISQTVSEIKETVTDQYESVVETVTETLDWREQFRKHSVTWSLGALAAGYLVGSGIAGALKDDDGKKKKGAKEHGIFSEIFALGEVITDELSEVSQTILLPALTKKLKDTFGIDIADKLQGIAAARHTGGSKKSSSRKTTASKSAGKRSAGKKGAAGKRASAGSGAKKSSAKKSATKKSGAKKSAAG
ncbi:MAG TPA: hypothetical protein VF723_14265 [Pyrinomonadaceae bacterium]|jgi:hypothetical protein